MGLTQRLDYSVAIEHKDLQWSVCLLASCVTLNELSWLYVSVSASVKWGQQRAYI